jgi:hypothetical protein
MSFLDVFTKIGSIIAAPIKIITEVVGDWAREPLKGREHTRYEQSKDNELRRQLERDNNQVITESKIHMQEAEHVANLEIKINTEITRITKEIEEWQKDKQFDRLKMVTEVVMIYHEKLTSLNINAIVAIGHMELTLRDKANELILDKTKKYQELQEKAFYDAVEKFQLIETKFMNNDKVKDMLNTAVDLSLANIIKNASLFIDQLNSDIKIINQNIDLLAKNGQKFIENHLQQFNMLTLSEINEKLKINNPKINQKLLSK